MRRLVLVIFLVGCASTPEVLPDEAARTASMRAITNAIQSGEDESNDVGVFDVQVRYNPARCHCPDFEFHVRDMWVRAWATGSESTLMRLQTLARQSGDTSDIQFLEVRGYLTDTVRRSDKNVDFPVFEMVE